MNSNNFKAIVIFIIIIILFSFSSCDNQNDIDPNILETYKEILLVRESTKDTELANAKVQDILKKHNLTEAEFREILLVNMKDNKVFIKMIDSLRFSLQNELDTLK